MRNIFLDIGSHIGESLEEVLRPIYDIDEVIAIEPSSFGYKKLEKFRDSRLSIYKIAVSNFSGETTLYAAGSVGGSLFSDKNRHWAQTESVEVVTFSKFCLENLEMNSNIYIKINIEGSEFFLLKEIFLIAKQFNIKSILLSIDLPKVPQLAMYNNELNNLINSFPIEILFRTNKEVGKSIAEFLETKKLLKKRNIKIICRDIIRVFLPIDRNILRLIKPIFPRKIWTYFALKIGPNRARH